MSTFLLVAGVLLVLLVLYDLLQRRHAILRNFPLIGHFRYMLETIGPELRQYIVTSNKEERPFNRSQRSWIYASSKKENNYFGFGSDSEMERGPNFLILRPSVFPYRDGNAEARDSTGYPIPCAKILGEYRGREKAFRPSSIVNISGMSFGSLSGPAVEAMNRGAKLANVLHWTGEGGVSRHHKHGGDLVWQIGTGYFGCRDESGAFSLAKLKQTVANNPIRALEIKLSQGAKPGLGGVLPAKKVNREIAEARGVPKHRDCVSPSYHSEFSNADELLDFVELLAKETGLPVGIKSAVGETDFWEELAEWMATSDRGVDFITVDGGEGGTGAAPLVFTDHVAFPFRVAFPIIYKIFCRKGLNDKITFIGSGKLGFPESALFAFSIGCDLINVGREAMLSVGCIQAMRCHTNHCPTGVATQNKWLMRGLNPHDKAPRLANYLATLRKDIIRVSWACGVPHPALLTLDHVNLLDGQLGHIPVRKLFEYEKEWETPHYMDTVAVARLMDPPAPSD